MVTVHFNDAWVRAIFKLWRIGKIRRPQTALQSIEPDIRQKLFLMFFFCFCVRFNWFGRRKKKHNSMRAMLKSWIVRVFRSALCYVNLNIYAFCVDGRHDTDCAFDKTELMCSQTSNTYSRSLHQQKWTNCSHTLVRFNKNNNNNKRKIGGMEGHFSSVPAHHAQFVHICASELARAQCT